MEAAGQPMRIGFIGAGKMATALAKGFLAAGCTTAEHIAASDVLPAAAEHFASETGAAVVGANAEVAARSEIVFLAVKPQSMSALLDELRGLLQPRHLILSIAAGINLQTLAAGLGAERRLVRVMPNTPCLVGASASGFSRGGAATAEDGRLVERLLSAVGIALELPEAQLDAVTGLSGSGPAFVYVMIEALSDGGVRMGLPRHVATQLAAQTVLGAAKMVLETGVHPGTLKDAVASPGGTTIAGLHALERGGLRGCLMDAVEAATLRSRELGRSS
jgi:pyrroline-5-carboxylate reductase